MAALKPCSAGHKVIGILIGFVLVVAYCYAGGIRASIWTDATLIVRDDRRFNHPLLVAVSGVGGFLASTTRSRTLIRHGQHVPGRFDLRRDVVGERSSSAVWAWQASRKWFLR